MELTNTFLVIFWFIGVAVFLAFALPNIIILMNFFRPRRTEKRKRIEQEYQAQIFEYLDSEPIK